VDQGAGRFERHGTIEPGQKYLGPVWVEGRFFDLDQFAAGSLEHNPLQAVRGNTDEFFSFFALAVGEIVRHSPENIRPFLVEVLLGLKYGPADQRIEPTFDLRDAPFEIEVMKLNAEFLDQQLAEIRLDLIVPGAPGEVSQ